MEWFTRDTFRMSYSHPSCLNRIDIMSWLLETKIDFNVRRSNFNRLWQMFYLLSFLNFLIDQASHIWCVICMIHV